MGSVPIRRERNFRTAPDICALIVKAAAMDSNLLLNIGPDGSGQLPAKAVAALDGVGKWMEANGHAIYGTRGAGFSKAKNGTITAKTRKGDTTYVFTVKPGEYPVLAR